MKPLLVLDIIHTGAEPGTIYRLSEEDLVQKESQRLSIHDIDLIDSLRMAEMLGGKKPTMHVLGMEPFDYTTWNIGLSAPLSERYPAFLQLAREEIQAILASF